MASTCTTGDPTQSLNTRIPRVRTPQPQRHVISQKPPPGGVVVKPRPVSKRSTSSAPSSRSSSPSPKQNSARVLNGIDKRPTSPMPGKRTPGSPVVKRSSAPSSPSARRNSLPKNGTSPADKPPSSPAAGRARAQKTAAKTAKSSPGKPTATETSQSAGQEEVPGKRVPTPMIQRKEMGAYSDVSRNRTPIVSLTNKTAEDTGRGLVKAKVLTKSDTDLSPSDENGSSNKENRLSSSLYFKPGAKTDQTASPADDMIHGQGLCSKSAETLPSVLGMTGASSSGTTPLKQQPSSLQIQNTNNNSQRENNEQNDSGAIIINRKHAGVSLQNGNHDGQDQTIVDYVPSAELQQMHMHSIGGLYSPSVVGHRPPISDLERHFTPIPLSVSNEYADTQDSNMNQCPTSNSYSAFTRNSGYPYFPESSAHQSMTGAPMHRSSMSMSLPVLSNGHYSQGKQFYGEPRHNNNNIKNLMTSSLTSSTLSSKLTDVIPKNAGEELSSTDIGDDSIFVSGIPVMYPEALELGGQGLCENCDDVKSPESPSSEMAPTTIPDGPAPPKDMQAQGNGHLLSGHDAVIKSQSCPNLTVGDPTSHYVPQTPNKPTFLTSDLVYEKYPPIRSLDVNKLDEYREEQLREYYQYLKATGNKNGWLSADSGQEVQRISVITQLPTLLNQENNSECLRRVVPKIREVLHVAQPDMQLAACSAFLQILQEEKVPLQNYTQTFLQTILNSIDNRDPDIANAWMDTLLDVIDLLPKDVIKKDIMSLAIAKGQLSQSVQSRLSCCKILGKIATKFDPFIIKKDILPIVQSLCQDVDYEVRGCMCRQLDSVARGLGLDQTKSAILPELVELTNDEESFVRLAGLETVVSVLSLLDDDTCTQTIIPLVCKFCQQALSNEDTTLPVVAKQLGKLCHRLSVNFTEEQRRWFVEYYQKLCKFGAADAAKRKAEQQENAIKPSNSFLMFPNDTLEEADISEETRRNAGFNFPAMVMFAGVRHFKGELFSSFHSLCSDSHYNVRKTVSSGFHEVAKLLANNSSILLPEFINMLHDESIEVLKGLISHLPESLEILIKSANISASDNKAHVYSDLLAAILSSEGVIFASNNWRLQEELMQQLAYMPKCFTSEQIFHKFIPLLFRKLYTAKALPVKLAAAKTILVLMRQNRRFEQREEMCLQLVDGLCGSNSCHQRSLFIDLCQLVLDSYSRSFFKEHFFEAILELTADKVPNVRLRLCPLLPRLKALLKLPGDRNLLQALEQNVRKLLVNEKDRDVTEAIDRAVKDMDKVEVQMESITKKSPVSEDLDDKKKMEEEKKLLELEEQDKKDEELRAAKADKKKDGSSKKDGPSSKIPGPKRGSKIPAATSISKEKVPSASSSKERSSSFSGNTQGSGSPNSKNVKRSTSFNTPGTNKSKAVGSKESIDLPSGRRGAPGSASSTASSRKSSAGSMSSSSSGSLASAKGRRSSIPLNSLGTDVTKKTSAPQRKLSTGSLTSNGTGMSGRKK